MQFSLSFVVHQVDIPPRLLEPGLPGAWIAQHRRIWQMDLLSARELAGFCHDRGLSFSSFEEDIIQLWQLGLLKADLVESRRKYDRVGLVDRGTNRYGQHVYSDERQIRQRPKGWGKPVKTARSLPSDVQLLFHPFRYYVLYHLNRVLELQISRMQMFNQEGYHRVLDIVLSNFNSWTNSEQFIPCIEKWNDTASLAIVSEPCTYVSVFHAIKFSGADVTNFESGAEEIRQHMNVYWNNVHELYCRIGIDRLEELRQELCVATQTLDSNRWVHTMLCLGRGELRLELKDKLGGALLIRTMAEMLRRAAEKAFDKKLLEEDELGFGWLPENIKEKVYGSNRLLDGNENVAREFLRQFQLHYGLRLRFYVEGATEWAALRHHFLAVGANYIEVINLRGEVAQKAGKGVTFRENLRSDISMHVFSIVLIDDDRSDFVSAVKKAAVDDEICGNFFVSAKDFEFANFELSELEEVLWTIALEDKESGATSGDRRMLHKAIQDAQNADELIKKARKAITQLSHLSKGEEWGKHLIKFTWEHPLKQGKERQVIQAIRTALTTKTVSYEVTRRDYKVDESTGQLVKRSS